MAITVAKLAVACSLFSAPCFSAYWRLHLETTISIWQKCFHLFWQLQAPIMSNECNNFHRFWICYCLFVVCSTLINYGLRAHQASMLPEKDLGLSKNRIPPYTTSAAAACFAEISCNYCRRLQLYNYTIQLYYRAIQLYNISGSSLFRRTILQFLSSASS